MNYTILNIFGMSSAQISDAVAAAEKVIKPEDIKEIWMHPEAKLLYVYIDGLPCVAVPFAYAPGETTCQ